MPFAEKLKFGKGGENVVAAWVASKGYAVLPVYEVEGGDFKGPRIFEATRELIAPDMLAMKPGAFQWIEAKHKSAFSWHRISQKFVTGIDLNHYRDYVEVARRTGLPLWIMFLHRAGRAKDTPEGMASPTGLFGQEIGFLQANENHRHQNHGRHGMVYWAHPSLKKFAELADLEGVQSEA